MTSGPELSRTDSARSVLLSAGADVLARRPWQHLNEAPDDTTLARFALWRAAGQVGTARTSEVEAGLALIDSARSDLESVESALVFTARAEGLTWAQIAEAMGMRSPQAAQQRYQRAAERSPAGGDRPAGDDHA